jgi:tetratricopeptide (TPR) repeat protein
MRVIAMGLALLLLASGCGDQGVDPRVQEAYDLVVSGSVDEGIAMANAILVDDPDHAGAMNVLGLGLYKAGDAEGSIQQYLRALEVRPDFPEAHFNLGNSHVALLHRAKAEAAFRRAVELEPDFVPARYNLGKIHDGAGRKEEALAEFQKCAELAPQFIPAILSAGQLLDGKGDYPGAIGYYERLLELDPAFKEGRVLLGNAWIRSGAPDAVSRAGEQFRIAVEIDQEYLDGVYSLAVACGLMNKIDDAARWYRRVLELAEPGSVVAVEATRFLTTQLPPPPEGASD